MVSVLFLVVATALSEFTLRCSGQPSETVQVIWCNGDLRQYDLCMQLQRDIDNDMTLWMNKGTVPVPVGPRVHHVSLACDRGQHAYDCLERVKQGKAHVVRLSAEQMYGVITHADYSVQMVAVAAGQTREKCPYTTCSKFTREFGLVVIRKDAGIRTVEDLFLKRPCFSREGSTAGWLLPMSKVLPRWLIKTQRSHSRRQVPLHWRDNDDDAGTPAAVDPVHPRFSRSDECPVDLEMVTEYFSQACAPGSWAHDEVYKGNFSKRLCNTCPADCITGYSEPLQSALECVQTKRGDLALVSNRDIEAMFGPSQKVRTNVTGIQRAGMQMIPRESLDLAIICANQITENILEWPFCHIGAIPQDGYITAKRYEDTATPPELIGQFIGELYGKIQIHPQYYPTTQSFLADNTTVIKIPRLDLYYGDMPEKPYVEIRRYLEKEGGEHFMNAMSRSFPNCTGKDRMRLCVHNQLEKIKCELMKVAFASAGLPPASLDCVLGYTEEGCIKLINESSADLTMAAAHRADLYIRDRHVVPLLSEEYDEKDIYSIAVAYSTGNIRKLEDLKSGTLGVCSSGTDTFAGWEAPNRVFKDLGFFPKQECRLTEAWATMFKASCVPGARNATITLGRNATSMPIKADEVQRLCEQCSGELKIQCKTPTEATDVDRLDYDAYYGDIGAIKCLIHRKADVAFVQSTALYSTFNLNDDDYRNLKLSDFVLLCGNGSSSVTLSRGAEKGCHLAKMPNRLMVARSTASFVELKRWQDLWIMALGRTRNDYDWLKTYLPVDANAARYNPELIFSNHTQWLKRFDFHNMTADTFHKLVHTHFEDPFECGRGSFRLPSVTMIFIILVTCIASSGYLIRVL